MAPSIRIWLAAWERAINCQNDVTSGTESSEGKGRLFCSFKRRRATAEFKCFVHGIGKYACLLCTEKQGMKKIIDGKTYLRRMHNQSMICLYAFKSLLDLFRLDPSAAVVNQDSSKSNLLSVEGRISCNKTRYQKWAEPLQCSSKTNTWKLLDFLVCTSSFKTLARTVKNDFEHESIRRCKFCKQCR